MTEFYLAAVVLLFALAIIDLMVGVNNDAVNFLNSAIGSRVAPRWTIMVVATLGILIGTSFSSGMMEVARKGIFNPQMFTFADVMVVFLAVVLTDVILLDLFNTFGMPTSTTVSIVFEILGASVLMAIIKSSLAADVSVADYVNGANALRIISGILLAVGIAFAIGTIVQFVARLLFTFQFANKRRAIAAIWSGLSMTIMILFLFIKGLKGATFLESGALLSHFYHQWWEARPFATAGLLAIASLFLMAILEKLRINTLQLTVLVGTFSLAMAFAGNDLVNFIGVPVAGYQSYQAWSASGTAPADFSVAFLKNRVATEPLFLILASAIMAVTLWLSKKARSVTETEVNFGRQSAGHERFQPNSFSRGLTRWVLFLGRWLHLALPSRTKEWIERHFAQPDEYRIDLPAKEQPAFDLVRASVNLTVASVLIALATSYKLPLSTTYVSFMVAMGTSLSDRAWGRESAVHRVSGVLHVIGGWFMTALIAFSAAAVLATLIHYTGLIRIIIAVCLAAASFYHSFRLHRRREKHADEARHTVAFHDANHLDVTTRVGLFYKCDT